MAFVNKCPKGTFQKFKSNYAHVTIFLLISVNLSQFSPLRSMLIQFGIVGPFSPLQSISVQFSPFGPFRCIYLRMDKDRFGLRVPILKTSLILFVVLYHHSLDSWDLEVRFFQWSSHKVELMHCILFVFVSVCERERESTLMYIWCRTITKRFIWRWLEV